MAASPTKPAIIRAEAAHIDQIAPLFDGYRQFYGQPADLAIARQFVLDRLRNNESVVFLALQHDVAVGFIQLFPLFSSVAAGRIWLLNDLFVAPDARRQGVAEALLERAKQFAYETGALRVELATAHDNPAQRLYERLGWQRDTGYHYAWTAAPDQLRGHE